MVWIKSVFHLNPQRIFSLYVLCLCRKAELPNPVLRWILEVITLISGTAVSFFQNAMQCLHEQNVTTWLTIAIVIFCSTCGHFHQNFMSSFF